MAKSVNKVILLGNLGRDIEDKFLPSGMRVSTFPIATSSSFKDKSGEYQERTEWTNIKVWGKLAEIASKYLHKGSQVHIIGRLETESWDDKDSGKKVYKTVVVAEELTLLGGKGDGEPASRGSKSEDRPIDDSDDPF